MFGFLHDIKAEDCIILKPFSEVLIFRSSCGSFLKHNEGACKCGINNVGVLSCPSWTVLPVKVWRCVLRTSQWGNSGILKNVCESRFYYFSLVILYILSAVFWNIKRSFSLDVATNTVITLYLHSRLLVRFIFSSWLKQSFFLCGP